MLELFAELFDFGFEHVAVAHGGGGFFDSGGLLLFEFGDGFAGFGGFFAGDTLHFAEFLGGGGVVALERGLFGGEILSRVGEGFGGGVERGGFLRGEGIGLFGGGFGAGEGGFEFGQFAGVVGLLRFEIGGGEFSGGGGFGGGFVGGGDHGGGFGLIGGEFLLGFHAGAFL